jgi:Effector Associated Constant Component 1
VESLRIEAPDDEAGDELRSLADWFEEDEDLNEVAVAPIYAAPKPGQMGSVVEALSAMAQQKEAITAIVTALVTWLSVKKTSTRIRVKRGNKEVEIRGTSIKNSEEAVARIMRDLD